MNRPTRFCKHCSAQISADAQFCKACGKPVESSAVFPAAPSVPTRSSQPTWLIVGCIAAIVLIACVAVIGVGGFFFFQNAQARATPTLISVFVPSAPTPTIAPSAPSTIVMPPTLPALTVAPTAALTPAPSPTPKCPPPPALAAGILFSDDFASRQVSECNGWEFQSGEAADYTWAVNQHTISLRRQRWLGLSWPNVEYADFGAETQAQPLGSNYAEYGIVFRLGGDSNTRGYYIFGLQSDGKYYLQKRVAGQWADQDPVSVTTSSTIKTGGAQNIIGVIAQGTTISLYINRALVKTITDTSITGKGFVGIFAGTGDNDTATVAFSKFVILTPDKAKAEWGSASSSTSPSSSQPQIVSLEFPGEIPANGVKHDGLVRFRDDGDDIARISFEPNFAQPPSSTYEPFGFEFTNPAVRWVEGSANSTSGAFKFSLHCFGETIKVTYTATLYDKAGNRSAPYPFSFLCKATAANTFTVFFTIQNGSPTGYVIDKSGVKHTPPGYLTIADLHIAPGDRIVIQTDQSRFSLLFDCGTSPQTFTPCDFVATTAAGLPVEIRKNTGGTAYLNISRADNWAGVRSNFPSQRYPADPVLRIGFGN